MHITKVANMSPASKDALAKVEAIRDPLDDKREELANELCTFLAPMKEKEREIRGRIKANNELLYVCDMDRAAIHKAQGIGVSAAIDAAVKAVSDKY